eukprot:546391-Pyramimonas_sp.AAC.1
MVERPNEVPPASSVLVRSPGAPKYYTPSHLQGKGQEFESADCAHNINDRQTYELIVDHEAYSKFGWQGYPNASEGFSVTADTVQRNCRYELGIPRPEVGNFSRNS